MLSSKQRGFNFFNSGHVVSLVDRALKEQEALALLRNLGYTIILPVKEGKTLSNKKLQEYFYKNMIIIAGSAFATVSVKDLHEDLKDLKEAQQKAHKKYGISKYHFNRDIKFLLDKLFINYNQLGVENLTRLGWLFTDAGSWVLRKVAAKHATDYYEMVVSALLEDSYE